MNQPPIPAPAGSAADAAGAASAAAAASQRREHVRRMLQVDASASVGEGAASRVRLIDICRAGVAFATQGGAAEGDELALSFQISSASEVISVRGRVVYVAALNDAGWLRVGARLTEVSEDSVQAIVDFVTAPKYE